MGYVHTGIAIVMLFRPYRELRFLGIRLQGMIPRRRAEIARSVARVVASDLLREESVAERVGGPEVRRALAALALEAARRLLGRDYGSLRSSLGPDRLGAAEQAVEAAGLELARLLREWLTSPPGLDGIEGALARLFERTPADLVPGEEDSLARLAAARSLEALGAEDLQDRLRLALRRLLPRLAAGDRPLNDLLPADAREALISAVRGSLPALLRRFEQVLLAPANVEKIKGAVRSGLRAYLGESQGGLVKNLLRQLALLGRHRIFREVDEVVDANLYRLGELVYEEENRAHLEAGVLDALGALLRRTPGELLGSLPPEASEAFCAQAAAWAAERLRRPTTAEALGRLAGDEMHRLFRTPLREIAAAGGSGPGAARRGAEAVAAWASRGGLEALFRRERDTLVALALDTPLGRPARLLPEGALEEFVDLGVERVLPALAGRVPEILRAVDVEGLIEREVLGLEARDIERVIVSVARRELGAIAWWGGFLGALVGGAQSLLQLVVP